MDERINRLNALLEDKAFVTEVLDAENEEAVQKLLADKGLEMSLTEIEVMGELLEGLQDGKVTKEQLEKLTNDGELTEDELENAAGGFLKELFYREEWCYFVNGKRVTEEVARKAGTYVEGMAKVPQVGVFLGAGALAVAAAAGIGYGIYDAVKRRW